MEASADVNATDQYGSGTLLTFHPAVMEYLLSKGADPNHQTNESGDPILCGVAYFNHWNVSACCCGLGPIPMPSSMAPPKRHFTAASSARVQKGRNRDDATDATPHHQALRVFLFCRRNAEIRVSGYGHSSDRLRVLLRRCRRAVAVH